MARSFCSCTFHATCKKKNEKEVWDSVMPITFHEDYLLCFMVSQKGGGQLHNRTTWNYFNPSFSALMLFKHTCAYICNFSYSLEVWEIMLTFIFLFSILFAPCAFMLPLHPQALTLRRNLVPKFLSNILKCVFLKATYLLYRQVIENLWIFAPWEIPNDI